MKKIITLSILLCIALGNSSCSWINYFYIGNTTDQTIKITYVLEQKDGIGIFDTNPEFYQLNKNNGIDHNHKLNNDFVVNGHEVSTELKPGECMVIGRLHNDHYTHYNQTFINDRVFNLDHIRFNLNQSNSTIRAIEFDTFFKNKNGNIGFVID